MMRKVLAILLMYIPAGFVAASILMVLILKWAPVTVTPLMLIRGVHNIGDKAIKVKYQWVSLNDISEDMVKAAISAEDNKFLWHSGFDFEEMERMRKQHMFDGSPIRGCSTISQQTAKNCFTLCSKTFFRKGIEAYYTVLIEKIWGKRRIMEVYLNVAEMGPGVFGVEAAARRYFHIHASDLTMADASSLVCCLPNPLHRDPDWVNRHLCSRREWIAHYSEKIKFESLVSTTKVSRSRL